MTAVFMGGIFFFFFYVSFKRFYVRIDAFSLSYVTLNFSAAIIVLATNRMTYMPDIIIKGVFSSLFLVFYQCFTPFLF